MQQFTTFIYGMRKHLCIPTGGLGSGQIFIHYKAKASAVLLPSRGKIQMAGQKRAIASETSELSRPPFNLSWEV